MVVLLLFTHFAFSSENAFGQQTITVQFEKQSLSEVLQVLKQKTGFEFLYNDEEIKGGDEYHLFFHECFCSRDFEILPCRNEV